MKMYLISDNVDTYTGMRLAGVDGIVIHEREELRTALDPRPSRNRAKKRFHHFLYHRSHWLKTLVTAGIRTISTNTEGGIPLDIRRKDHAFKDDFHGAGPG